MSRLSSEEEQRLIADAEAARDDPDVQMVPSRLRVEKDAPAILTLRLSFTAVSRLQRGAVANGLSPSELVERAIDRYVDEVALPRLGTTSPTGSVEIRIPASLGLGQQGKGDVFHAPLPSTVDAGVATAGTPEGTLRRLKVG